jgi:hypothetical protein
VSRRRRTVLIILGVLVGIVIILQLIPWGNMIPLLAVSNPPVQTEIQWNSVTTEQLVRNTCYDCHSNETVWPWYSTIVPVSWLVAGDVNEGRQHLNFSTTTADQINPAELIEQIQSGEMPPKSYKARHPSANLTDAQNADLIAGIQASLHGQGESGGEGGGNGDKD